MLVHYTYMKHFLTFWFFYLSVYLYFSCPYSIPAKAYFLSPSKNLPNKDKYIIFSLFCLGPDVQFGILFPSDRCPTTNFRYILNLEFKLSSGFF